MADTRKKDANWSLCLNADGRVPEGQAQLAVLMDIRDELKQLNSVIGCHNFTRIPSVLDGIRRNTAKPRKKRRKETARRRD